MEQFKVINVDEYNMPNNELFVGTEKECDEEIDSLTTMFPHSNFSVEPYRYKEPSYRTYNKRQADGWEDIYPLDN